MKTKISEADHMRILGQRLREFKLQPTLTDSKRTINEDVAGLDNQDFQEEKTAFQEAVGVQFEITNYNNSNGVVELRGKLKFSQDLNFTFTTRQNDGLYVEIDGKGQSAVLQLDEQVIEGINKLRAYYDVWYTKSIEKINNHN